MLKIGWWSTGKDEAAQDLLVEACFAIDKGEIFPAEISYVFCNRELGENNDSDKFLDLVLRSGIPLITFSSAKFEQTLRKENLDVWRGMYHDKVRKLLENCKEDLRFLAGYMLILDDKTCIEKPAINLHPALPNGPKGTWQEVISQLIKEKAQDSGNMIHLASPKLDSGPVLTFCRFPIFVPYKTDDSRRLLDLFNEDKDRKILFKNIRKIGLQREFPLIIETLKLLASGEINIKEGKVFNKKGENLFQGLDLTSCIEKIMDVD